MSEPKSRRIPKPIWFGVAAVLMMVLWVVLNVWLPYHREQVVIREIENLGGEAFDLGLRDPKWSEWLQKIVSGDWVQWLDRADYVDLACSGVRSAQVNDKILKRISGLTNLNTLNLGYTAISDEGLRHLRDSTNLRDLALTDTHVSDEGLKHLSSLINLKELFLSWTQISDEGVKHLSSLSKLERLDLYSTQISDKGLKHLRGLTNLKILILYKTQVSEEGIQKLKKAISGCSIEYTRLP